MNLLRIFFSSPTPFAPVVPEVELMAVRDSVVCASHLRLPNIVYFDLLL